VSAICVITARGGSKRIPRKNIRGFCGKPIIAYSIEAAISSNIFDEVMVSTDDEEIATISRRYGASVPFLRSAQSSDDYASTPDVLKEVLDEYERLGRYFDIICCLYPTAPFVTADELNEAVVILNQTGAPSVIPVTVFDFPPQRAFAIAPNGTIQYAEPEYAMARSQDLPARVHDCGRFYFSRVDAFRGSGSLVMEGTVPMMISPHLVQDIDTPEDWAIAEMKYRLAFCKGDRVVKDGIVLEGE